MSDRKPSILGLSRIDLAVFVAYLVVLFGAVSIYVPWEDEGRAWVIARDNSLYTMLFKLLRYEGHPSFWYLILWLPAHLHLAYIHINWISAGIAAAGVYVLLRYAPFPIYVRALLPFGFALQYQYAVVARSYVLFPLLGFTVAHLYRSRQNRPIALAVALAAFANISIHATLVAIGFAVCFCWEVKQQRDVMLISPVDARNLRIAGAIFVSGILFVAICVWPPKELQGKIIELLGFHHAPQKAAVTATPTPHLLPVVDQPGAPASSQRRHSFVSRAAKKLAFVLVYPVASFHPLAYLFECVLLVYLYRRRLLLLTLPIALLVGFFTFGYGQFWHLEMLWVTLLMVLWIAWDEPGQRDALTLQRALQVLLVLLCILQLPWTIGAIRYEFHDPMFPAEAAADYFKTLPPGTRTAGRGRATTLLPYFSGWIFSGYSKDRAMDLIAAQPDLILVDNTMSPEESEALSAADYRKVRSFCGSYYFPNVPPAPLCLIFLTKDHTSGL